jgi:hypothetical protein
MAGSAGAGRPAAMRRRRSARASATLPATVTVRVVPGRSPGAFTSNGQPQRRPRGSRPTSGRRIVSRVEAARVLEVLRDDITWIAEAASPEQRAQLDGDGAPDLARGAVWGETPEGQQARRDQVERQRASYERFWGMRAPW